MEDLPTEQASCCVGQMSFWYETSLVNEIWLQGIDIAEVAIGLIEDENDKAKFSS